MNYPSFYIDFGWSWKTPFDDLDYITQKMQIKPSKALRPGVTHLGFIRKFYLWAFYTQPIKGFALDKEIQKIYLMLKDKKEAILDIQEKIQEKAYFCCVIACHHTRIRPCFEIGPEVLKFLSEIDAIFNIDWC